MTRLLVFFTFACAGTSWGTVTVNLMIMSIDRTVSDSLGTVLEQAFVKLPGVEVVPDRSEADFRLLLKPDCADGQCTAIISLTRKSTPEELSLKSTRPVASAPKSKETGSTDPTMKELQRNRDDEVAGPRFGAQDFGVPVAYWTFPLNMSAPQQACRQVAERFRTDVLDKAFGEKLKKFE